MSEIMDDYGIEALEIPPVQLISCPRCKAESPNHYFCVNCGQPLTIVDKEQAEEYTAGRILSTENPLEDLEPLEDSGDVESPYESSVSRIPIGAQSIQESEEPASGMSYIFEPIEEPEKMESVGPGTSVQVEQEPHAPEIHAEGKKKVEAGDNVSLPRDDVIGEAMRDLVKRVSLLLWLSEMLGEGRLKEDYFTERFQEYRSAFDASVSRREALLGHARDVEGLEAALERSKVSLEEFEERRNVGDLGEGEYTAKLPAMRWDIDHYESELFLRNQDRADLEDATWLVPNDDVRKLRDRAIATRDALNAHDPESYHEVDLAVVTAPLDRITVLLGELMVTTEEANPHGKKAKNAKKGK